MCDGSEIHEASAYVDTVKLTLVPFLWLLSLLACGHPPSVLVHLSRHGADVAMFAPDMPQMHVVDHSKGEPSQGETR